MIAVVASVERTQEEGAEVTNVIVDIGGGNTVEAEFYEPSGQDAPPLNGDAASTYDSTESGSAAVVAFNDPKNPGIALPGERRTYARDPDGNIVAEIWAKRDGNITLKSLKSGGTVNVNGVIHDQDGNVTIPGKLTVKGEVTAMSETAPVKLSSHLHPTGVGPSGAPTPGT